MDAKTVLTGFLGQPVSRPDLANLLAEAGLELWQAPEGFWAVRLKQAPAPLVSRIRPVDHQPGGRDETDLRKMPAGDGRAEEGRRGGVRVHRGMPTFSLSA